MLRFIEYLKSPVRIMFFMIATGSPLAVGCSEDSIGPDNDHSTPNVIVPLAEGNFWRYDVIEYNAVSDTAIVVDSIQYAIVGQLELEGSASEAFIWAQIDIGTGVPIDTLCVVLNDSIGLQVLGECPYLDIKYPALPGDSWQRGCSGSNPVPDLTWTCIALNQEVCTSAGTFECIQYTGGGRLPRQEYYCPNIGMIYSSQIVDPPPSENRLKLTKCHVE